jgi:cyclic-di-GMP-binding protein
MASMAKFSFDIASEYDLAEMINAFEQTKREITNRYDFKNTPAQIDWLENKTGVKITGNSDWQIDTIVEIFRKKLASRGIDQKTLVVPEESNVSGMVYHMEVKFVHGLNSEDAKKLSKLIRDSFPKAKPQINGDIVRVVSNSKDELQAIIQELRKSDFKLPLVFKNYR